MAVTPLIANLQALRALAAWAVALHHLRPALGEIWAPLGETLIFAAGVDLFFVLSGAVMVLSTDGRGLSPLAFWTRRLTRVAPLYWAVTLALVAMLAAGLSPVGIAAWDGRDLAASLLFIADPRADGYPGPLLGVGWTLTYEAFFYLLFGAALWTRRAEAAVIGALAALVGLGALWGPDGFAARVYTAPILLEFALGALIGRWALGGAPRWTVFMAPLGGVLLVIGAAALAALAPSGDLITPWGAGASWRTLCFGAPAALILMGAIAAERAGLRLSAPWVMEQGAASYALYLTHLIVFQMVERALGAQVFLLIPLLAAAAAALMIHRWVEQPLTALARGRPLRLAPG